MKRRIKQAYTRRYQGGELNGREVLIRINGVAYFPKSVNHSRWIKTAKESGRFRTRLEEEVRAQTFSKIDVVYERQGDDKKPMPGKVYVYKLQK